MGSSKSPVQRWDKTLDFITLFPKNSKTFSSGLQDQSGIAEQEVALFLN